MEIIMSRSRLIVPLLMVVGLWCALGQAWAGEPPGEPILRIETGMHQAMIRRIGVDVANRYLVTGSEDKTARVWDLRTGTLLRALRLPIGPGDEGKIYAVAISPDGRTVAVGGSTGWDFDGSASIYLFDRASGRINKRLIGLPNVVQHLAFAPDGQVLVAALGGKNGIRVYRTSDYTLTGEDPAYGGASYGAAFDRNGRLVTTSEDGFVRLYDSTLHLLAKKQVPGGIRPFGVAFSPDGSQVAVGFADSTKVAVLSGQDLSFRFAPDTTAVTNGNLSKVAWSADGSRLYAGGKYDRDGMSPVRLWTNGGRGPASDVPAAPNTIMHVPRAAAGRRSGLWSGRSGLWRHRCARPPDVRSRSNHRGLPRPLLRRLASVARCQDDRVWI